jgi:transposase
LEKKLSVRQIAGSCSVSHSTVLGLLRRADEAGLTWPLPAELDDATLEAKLYPSPPQLPPGSRPQPNMELIHRELRRKDVTLQLLWQEYKAEHHEGYQYSQFCDLYRRWKGTIDVAMRQEYRAGEKAFVDWAGQTVPVVDSTTGEVRQTKIFVAVLGASNYTYVEAARSQELASWIDAHCRAFTYFAGVPSILVIDNLRTGVSRSCRYEPEINPTYHEMSTHYGTVVIPGRVAHPRDNSKAEVGVQIVQRQILAPLRKRTFFSLTELNEAIREKLEALNRKPFQKLEGTRHSHYVELDRPALKPLPENAYEFAQWKQARVNIDHHIEVDHNYYSVPYQLVKKQVDVRFTSTAVEVLFKGKRVASHQRFYGKGRYSTVLQHRPPSHKKYLEWTPERVVNWAKSVGPNTGMMAQGILERRAVPEQGIRSCLGLLRLAKGHTPQRLEAACARALTLGAYSYQSVKSILAKGLDQTALEERPASAPLRHENLRGAAYFSSGGGENEC